MKNYILVVVTLFGINPLFSQELIVDSGVVLKKGAYRNFEEFRSNSPSISYSGEVVDRNVLYGILGLGGSIKYYGINGTIEGEIKTKKLYGFSDGKNVYYNTNFSFISNINFVKFDYLGRYCYIDHVVKGSQYVSSGINGSMTVSKSPNNRSEAIIDINDGQYYEVTKTTMKLLFAMNDSLTQQLKERRLINPNYKDLLIEYSEIHRDKILRVLPDNTRLDHLIYKNSSDSTLLDYESRMLSYISDPMILEMKVVKSYYGNDQLKVFGIWAKHENGNNANYPYDIGTWYHFHKNGQIKEEVNYNLLGQKNGLNVKYDEQGNVIKELIYVDGELVPQKL